MCPEPFGGETIQAIIVYEEITEQMSNETKQDVIDDITRAIGAPRIWVSNGSTEPRIVFEVIVDRFTLPIAPHLTKPELAQRISEGAGISWDNSCDSRGTPSGGGSTVTIEGLRRVRRAVRKYLDFERARNR